MDGEALRRTNEVKMPGHQRRHTERVLEGIWHHGALERLRQIREINGRVSSTI